MHGYLPRIARKPAAAVFAVLWTAATLAPAALACLCGHDALRAPAIEHAAETVPACHAPAESDAAPVSASTVAERTDLPHSHADCGCLHAHDPHQSAPELVTVPTGPATVKVMAASVTTLPVVRETPHQVVPGTRVLRLPPDAASLPLRC